MTQEIRHKKATKPRMTQEIRHEKATKPRMTQEIRHEKATKPRTTQKIRHEKATKPRMTQEIRHEKATKPRMTQEIRHEKTTKPRMTQEIRHEKATKPRMTQDIRHEKATKPRTTQGIRHEKATKPKRHRIILAILVSWVICAIITAAGGFPDDPKHPNFFARTDARTIVLQESNWFRFPYPEITGSGSLTQVMCHKAHLLRESNWFWFPYPGQWGTPTVSAAGVFGMLAGVLASMIESVGDYYACARLSGAPPPPKHAINRGIGVEGIGCLITGLWGSGNGTTSYSQNIGAIGITKVGSLRVIQYAGLILVVLGVVGKIGALFTIIPDPFVGGVFMVMFGMVAAVGISNLQFINLNSSRNLFIIGVSLMLGFALPWYLNKHPETIATGSQGIDQIVTVLLKTSMAVGGITGLILDNALPGTPEERGILLWRKIVNEGGDESSQVASFHIYDLPFGLNRLCKFKIAKYLPFVPYYPVSLHDESEEATGYGKRWTLSHCAWGMVEHYLTMLGGTLSIPFILSGPMCFSNNPLVVAEVLSTIFFVSGISTLLQTTFGVRLPIIQGGTFSFLAPTFAILSLPQFKCPTDTDGLNITANATTDKSGDWRIRMREIQGAIMVSSLFQIFIGFSGVMGFLLRFIGPIAVAPTITLIGLSLFHVAAEHAGNHWGVAFM
ncbi:predicted protein [Nematostella vectensis]|uniref:Solute carrier family 23 member 2 n=1 Tax=Nematostella vectensis TaxID=45351 RepID=A7SRV0_NEMVE|nr:predicted protein [Nematostella vectensis]|eukprot:XP_001625681.1 predicted protein [Nematostella vectensis]